VVVALSLALLACGGSGTKTLEGPVSLRPAVSTAVSPNLARQGRCSSQLEVRSLEWGEEPERHPVIQLTNTGDLEVTQAFLYFDLYDARGAKLTTLMAEARVIRPGETVRAHARIRPSGDEARCELVRIITLP
jgi:hypothetical protein